MPEPTTQNVLHDLARAKAATQSCEAHGTRLMQLEADLERTEQALRGLQAQIAQVNPMVAEIEGLDQRVQGQHGSVNPGNPRLRGELFPGWPSKK